MAEETGEAYERIVVSGGGSNSDVLMHIFADVFGIPAVRSKMNNAAGLGSAICAAVGQGLYRSWDEAIENMVAWEPAFAPDTTNHHLYQRMAAVYDEIPSLTDRVFERSYEIFG
jgi:sugar (pentulose or hexulose) kinase